MSTASRVGGIVARLLRTDPHPELADVDVRAGFDAEFYRRTYPDVQGTDDDLLRDFLATGWLLGRDPSPLFSTNDYVETHADVRAAGINPLVHFVRDGRREGRRPRPSRAVSEGGGTVSGPQAYRGLVDPRFYRTWYPDAVRTGLRPDEHLHGWGWHEGRDPAPWFDARFYNWSNPEVRATGADPLVHFLQVGRAAGRPPRDPLTLDRAAFLAPPVRVTPPAGGHGASGPVPGLGLATTARVVLAVVNRDHRRHRGGVEACTAHEEAVLVAAGTHYVMLLPVVEGPRLADSGDAQLQVLLDGHEVTRLPAAGLAGALGDLLGPATVERVVVHGLLGHHPESLAAAFAGLATDYWVHDFFALCENPALARSGLEFCGAPPVTSTACRVCSFGAARERHVTRVADFLDATAASVVAPSEAAADTWAALTGRDRSSMAVVPHGRLRLGSPLPPTSTGRSPRLAFVGAPLHTKGWDDFVEVARWAASRGDLDAVHMGEHGAGHPGIPDIPLARGGLTDALVEHDIDAVLLWSTVPETFSLVAYEAMAAGALVVTGPASGNLVAAAEEHGRALVYADRRRLRRAAVTGRLARSIAAFAAEGVARGVFVMDGLTPHRMGLA